jgi:hypothetical protein
MDHELGAAHIAAADRRIAEAEVRLMRMEELLAEMERDGHAWGLAEGRGLIATCERSLRVMYDCRMFWRELHSRRREAAQSGIMETDLQ